MSLNPTDRFSQILSEPLVEVSLGEREASIRTDPNRGWLWMLHTTPDGQSISRLRSPEHFRYISEYEGGARYLAGHLTEDRIERVEVDGAVSAVANGLWLVILPSADAATVRFLDGEGNVIIEYAIEAVPAPRRRRWYERVLNLFSMPRGRHTFKSRGPRARPWD